MTDALRQLILTLTQRGSNRSLMRQVMRLGAIATKEAPRLQEHLEALQRIEEAFNAETGSWVPPETIRDGEGGRFDACDLRHWLALAEHAGVPAVPAREILVLSEEEMDAAAGQVNVPGAVRRRLRQAVERYAPELLKNADDASPDEAIDREALRDRLADAMDEVPSGWMVRHVRCGPESLKALAGCGLSGPEAPEVRFNADLEVGPGWIRVGNRRMVAAADSRFLMGVSQGPGGPQTFVARPWVQAARWMVGEDPHRRGSRLAGKGMWPAEWRAFIEGDEVIGVSFYYAWAGEASPENAAMALRVRETAERILEEARRQGAIPALADIELAREVRGEHMRATLARRFPRDRIACTLDFIETDDGLLLLEGGPPYSPVGGGHPCAFAGLERPEGVAFRPMPGVDLGNPETWRETECDGCILDWEEVEELACAPDCQATPEP